MSLKLERISAVLSALVNSGARSVVDIGCGDGKLLKEIVALKQFESIIGLDTSSKQLIKAERRLGLNRSPSGNERVKLIQGSITERDQQIANFDAATVIEVIEHLSQSSLLSFEEAIFTFAKIRTVIVTTPNYEYNRMFDKLLGGKYRNKDHKFEFTTKQFRDWALNRAKLSGYRVNFTSIGPPNTNGTAPTQMAVFERIS